MKSIVVLHDSTFNNVDKMMDNIDYVAQHSKVFSEDFIIYCEESSPLVNVLKEAGLPFDTTSMPQEPDLVITFIYDLHDGTPASEMAMNQWKLRRPVWAFQVPKP